MEAEIIYVWLERIKKLVHANVQPDGTISVDEKKVEIALELCETVLLEGLEEQT